MIRSSTTGGGSTGRLSLFAVMGYQHSPAVKKRSTRLWRPEQQAYRVSSTARLSGHAWETIFEVDSGFSPFMPEPHALARSGCCRTVNWYHKLRFSLVTLWMRCTDSREAFSGSETADAIMLRWTW